MNSNLTLLTFLPFFFRSFERPAATIVPHGDGLATSLVFLSSDGAGLLDA